MKNRKGFTLTELLVTMVILGIITGLSIPLIRNLSHSFEKKKYKTYSDAVTSSAKLYTDSYSEDMFGHNPNGCAYITYDQLVAKDLLKDIDVSDMSCNSSSTFVRVLKMGDKYSYAPFLGCGTKQNGKAKSISVSLPESNQEYEMNTDYCAGIGDNNLLISALIGSDASSMNKKQKKTRLTITSATGINKNVVIYTAWSKNKTGYSQANFTRRNFDVPGSQKTEMEKGNIIEANSNEILTPANETGSFYLLVRVDNLSDLYGSNWKNPDGTDSKYVSFGPFVIDNTPPSLPTIVAYKKKNSTNITSQVGLEKIATNTWYNGYEFVMPTGSTDNSGGKVTYYYTTSGTESKQDEKGSYRNINTEGTTNIKFKACDQSGNCSKYTSNFVVKLDRTKPTCGDKTGGKTNWTKNQTVSVGVKCSDPNGSGCVKSSFTASISGNGKTEKKKITIKDNAGNEKDCENTYNKYIDTIAPTCGDKTGGKTNWTENQNVSVGVKCSDPDGSGCTKSSFTTNINGNGKTASATITISDKVGNTASCKNTYNKYIDTVAPTCGSKIGGKTNWTQDQNVSVGVNCTDPDGSGCTNSSFSTIISGNGKTSSATITIKDKVGHTTQCTNTYNKYIDTVAPTCGNANGSNTVWSNQARTISQECYDNGSGCRQATYQKSYSTGTVEGDSVVIYDNVGNASTCSYNVYLDTIPPRYDYNCVCHNKNYTADYYNGLAFHGQRLDSLRPNMGTYMAGMDYSYAYLLPIVYVDDTNPYPKSLRIKYYDTSYAHSNNAQENIYTNGVDNDLPGSGNPMVVDLYNLCDWAGNCICQNGCNIRCNRNCNDNKPSPIGS